MFLNADVRRGCARARGRKLTSKLPTRAPQVAHGSSLLQSQARQVTHCTRTCALRSCDLIYRTAAARLAHGRGHEASVRVRRPPPAAATSAATFTAHCCGLVATTTLPLFSPSPTIVWHASRQEFGFCGRAQHGARELSHVHMRLAPALLQSSADARRACCCLRKVLRPAAGDRWRSRWRSRWRWRSAARGCMAHPL